MKRRMVGKLIGWRGLMVLAVSLFATISWAGDVLKIISLLTYPVTYQGQQVRVTGVVTGHRMDQFIQNTMKRRACTQSFTVEDDTGSIDAVYETLCPTGTVILKNGDRATIEAQFVRAPGTAGILNVWSVTKK